MKLSFVVCTYDRELFDDTIKCINSIMAQSYKDKDVILVMDKDEELYNMFIDRLMGVNILINRGQGLSDARNTGIKNAKGDIIIFIDDDAYIGDNYISNLIKNYEDKKVVGVGGKILPNGSPNYPEELYWLGGFTHKGFPEDRCEIRNIWGCNMSFRKDVFDKVGLFNGNFGRIGKKLVSCEDTEFGIKVNSIIGKKIIYDPSVITYHKVHEYRQTFRYMIKRAYHEGISKARIAKLNNGLSTENEYLRYLLRKAIPFRIKNMIIGIDVISNTKDIISLLATMSSVGFGYITEKMKWE